MGKLRGNVTNGFHALACSKHVTASFLRNRILLCCNGPPQWYFTYVNHLSCKFSFYIVVVKTLHFRFSFSFKFLFSFSFYKDFHLVQFSRGGKEWEQAREGTEGPICRLFCFSSASSVHPQCLPSPKTSHNEVGGRLDDCWSTRMISSRSLQSTMRIQRRVWQQIDIGQGCRRLNVLTTHKTFRPNSSFKRNEKRLFLCYRNVAAHYYYYYYYY